MLHHKDANNRSGQAVSNTLHNTTIARDYFCLEYRHQRESHACNTKNATIVSGELSWNNTPQANNTIARDYSWREYRPPIQSHARSDTNRNWKAVVERHSPTTRLLVTVYVASTGVKKNHIRASPGWQQSQRGSCCRTTLPNTKIARSYSCREYRH